MQLISYMYMICYVYTYNIQNFFVFCLVYKMLYMHLFHISVTVNYCVPLKSVDFYVILDYISLLLLFFPLFLPLDI